MTNDKAAVLAPRQAKAILLAVYAGFWLVAESRIVYGTSDASAILASTAFVSAIATIQVTYFSRPRAQVRPPLSYLALIGQGWLVYVPLLAEFHGNWVGMPGFLAGSLLLALSWPIAWVSFALVIISMGVAQFGLSASALDTLYTLVSTTITGLVVFGLTRLANVVVELHDTRMELADLAVAGERLRVAQDLHDLLGYDLTAITLKAELSRRVMREKADRADAELADIVSISRRALVDVRSVSAAYRELSLTDELQSAESLLRAANVDVSVRLGDRELPMPTRTLLATALREGITNVLRHSRAARCEISVVQADGSIALEIINDGVDRRPHDSRGSGAGLPNLTDRVARVGGAVNAGVDENGRFHLRVWIPDPTVAAPRVVG